MNGTNEQRKLAPDTRWILSAVATVLVLLVGVFQYQLSQFEKQMDQLFHSAKRDRDQLAELTLARARSGLVTDETLNTALQARDARVTDVSAEVNTLNITLAQNGESLLNINNALQRVIDIALKNNEQSTKNSQKMNHIVSQADSSRQLAERMLDQQIKANAALADRLTHLEAQVSPKK